LYESRALIPAMRPIEASLLGLLAIPEQDAAAARCEVTGTLQEATMGRASLAGIAGAMLFFQAGCALAAPAVPMDSTSNSGRLIEGRAVYEAQVSFGGTRENDLGPGFDFGVPVTSKTATGPAVGENGQIVAGSQHPVTLGTR
jgi:hypothetical protein